MYERRGVHPHRQGRSWSCGGIGSVGRR